MIAHLKEDSMKRLAVIGNPIEHSLSPFIHHYFAEQTKTLLAYEKIAVPDDSFEETITTFFAQGGRGLNVTLPFKERAFAAAALSTPRCNIAKAANTLWMQDGHLHADNTDGVGLIKDLNRHLVLEGKRVLILGAGGAARGIISPLLINKVAALTIVNRSTEKLKQLARDFASLHYCSYESLKEENAYDLIINATSTGLSAERLDLPGAIVHRESYCYDLAYNLKMPTPFVSWATKQGVKALDGLGMLIEQAAEAFFIFNGLAPETAPLFKAFGR